MKIEFTTREAAQIVGVSDSRIRQLALAGEIEYRHFGKSLVITRIGIEQAQKRKTKRGPSKEITEIRAC